MLNFPSLILLNTIPTEHEINFSTKLMSHLDGLGIPTMVENVDNPLQDAVVSLVHDGDFLTAGFESDDFRNAKIAENDYLTNAALVGLLRDFTNQILRPGFLIDRCISRCRELLSITSCVIVHAVPYLDPFEALNVPAICLQVNPTPAPLWSATCKIPVIPPHNIAVTSEDGVEMAMRAIKKAFEESVV